MHDMMSALFRHRRNALFFSICLFAFLLASRRILDFDYWTHLAEGRRIARALFGPEPLHPFPALFTTSGNEGPFRLVLYLTHALGGDVLVSVTVALLSASIFVPFFPLVPRGMAAERYWLLGVLFSAAAATSAFRFLPRPELAAYLLFAAALGRVFRRPENRGKNDAVIITLLFCIWYPLHPSWAIGLFFVVLATVLRVGPVNLYRSVIETRGPARAGFMLLIAGAGGYLAYRAVLFAVFVVKNLLFTGVLARVTEMRPLWEFPDLAVLFSATSLLSFLLACSGKPGRIRRSILWCLAVVLGAVVVRNTVFALLVQIPLAIEGLALRADVRQRPPLAGKAVAGASLLSILLLLGYSLANQDPPSGIGTVRHLVPHDAALFAKEHRLPEPLFNNWDCGGYLLWAWDGAPTPFMDGRLGNQEKVDDHFRVLEAEPMVPTLRKYGFNTILLQAMYFNSGRLFPAVRWLLRSPEWKLVQASDALVFVRKDASSLPALPADRAWEYILSEANRRVRWQTTASHLPYVRALAYAHLRDAENARRVLDAAVKRHPDLFSYYAVDLLSLGVWKP